MSTGTGAGIPGGPGPRFSGGAGPGMPGGTGGGFAGGQGPGFPGGQGPGFPGGPGPEFPGGAGDGGGHAAPRRLHPLTPLARGWKAVVVIAAGFGQQAVRGIDTRIALLVLVVVFVVAAVWAGLSWAFTVYRIEADDLRVDSGVLFRRTRHVRLARLQAVDVVRPVVARMFGLAELRLQVAGGESAEAPLAYLREADAQALRAELLARAAGVAPDAGEAPERVLVTVPPSALVWSILMTGELWAAAAAALVVGGGLLTFQGAAALLVLLPLFVWAWQVSLGRFARWFDFTVAESPDGLRLRHGLLEQRHQTVPPGRVQAVRFVEPLLWRRRGWVKVEVNVAGYGGEDEEDRVSPVLLPVAPREVALALVARLLPGADVGAVPMVPAPRRARWRRPITWRGLACGADDEIFVARRGVLRRETDLIPHGKVQSVRRTQGPWERLLGLASVHLDSTPGPVQVTAASRDAAEAFELVLAQAVRSRTGRRREGPERWSR